MEEKYNIVFTPQMTHDTEVQDLSSSEEAVQVVLYAPTKARILARQEEFSWQSLLVE